MRGLKFYQHLECNNKCIVAPRTGAWIEINSVDVKLNPSPVAPRTGAWIEINRTSPPFSIIWSHPARVRGLKLVRPRPATDPAGSSHPARVRGLKYFQNHLCQYWQDVAPRTGAWIEITYPLNNSKFKQSHPARVRGLKYYIILIM